ATGRHLMLLRLAGYFVTHFGPGATGRLIVELEAELRCGRAATGADPIALPPPQKIRNDSFTFWNVCVSHMVDIRSSPEFPPGTLFPRQCGERRGVRDTQPRRANIHATGAISPSPKASAELSCR